MQKKDGKLIVNLKYGEGIFYLIYRSEIGEFTGGYKDFWVSLKEKIVQKGISACVEKGEYSFEKSTPWEFFV